MTLKDLENAVLLEVARQVERVESAPTLPHRRENVVERIRQEDERQHGPRYTPDWFGELGHGEARRQRLLRTVHRLAKRGFFTIVTGDAGRLANLKMTPAGWKAVESLRVTAS